MATDLGCPVWLRGTRGLLVDGDKHVKGLSSQVRFLPSQLCEYFSKEIPWRVDPRKGVVYKTIFCSHRPAPTVVPIYA